MLITFEGIDGSGKSTQAERLVRRLEDQGAQPLLVREPGGTALSERVRALLLDTSLHVEPLAELLLFSAARAQLVAERIRPALEAGHVVVCDRFYDSTTAYQGGGRGLDVAWLRHFNQRVTGGLVPDRTYLVLLDPALALQRRATRDGRPRQEHLKAHPDVRKGDRMEAAGEAFYERVTSAYRQLAEEERRIRCLDGTRSAEALHKEIWADVRRLMGRPRGTPAPAQR